MLRKLLFVFFISFFFFITNAIASEKVTVLLDWFLNPDHAPLFVAEQQGFFKAQGLDVTLIGPADSSDPPKLVAAGKADIAIDYEPQFMQQVARGLPLARIGSLINHPLNCLAVLQDGPIKSIPDLKNKNIGHSTGEVSSVMLQTMLQNHGLTLADVHSINVRYDLTQALLAKKVDAVTGVMRNFEIIQMQLSGHPARAFYPEENGVPTYDELIFVVNKNQLPDARFKKFLIAVKQGEDYLQKHPDEMWLAFAKAHPELNDELNKKAWYATLPYFAKDPSAFNQKDWKRFADFMKKNNLLEINL